MINASIIFSAKMALDTCMIMLYGGRFFHANSYWCLWDVIIGVKYLPLFFFKCSDCPIIVQDLLVSINYQLLKTIFGTCMDHLSKIIIHPIELLLTKIICRITARNITYIIYKPTIHKSKLITNKYLIFYSIGRNQQSILNFSSRGHIIHWFLHPWIFIMTIFHNNGFTKNIYIFKLESWKIKWPMQLTKFVLHCIKCKVPY